MALNPEVLKLELSKFIDQDHPAFESFPPNIQIAKVRWATALMLYLKDILPVSFIHLHQPALEAMILGYLQSQTFGQSFDNIINFLSTTMLTAMPAFVSVIGPVAPSTIPVFRIDKGKSGAQFINELVPIIDTYFRTGIATQTVSPFLVVPWS